MGKILTDEQISFYREHNYLHARGVIPEELLQLAEKILRRWVDETIEQWVQQGLLSDRFADLVFHHRLVKAWNEAGRPKYLRSPRRDLVSMEMFDFMRHPVFLDLAEDLLGNPEILAHGIFNARPKLPDQLWTDTPWHQDAQYYTDAANTHVISMWMPLKKVTEYNSCMQVAPGFFQDRLLEAYDDVSGFIGLSKQDAAKLKPVSVEMEPGDLLCFTQLMPHRALPNQSDAVRWSMDVRYEALPTATESGSIQGFTARSEANPDAVDTYEQWLEKWKEIPCGSY